MGELSPVPSPGAPNLGDSEKQIGEGGGYQVSNKVGSHLALAQIRRMK